MKTFTTEYAAAHFDEVLAVVQRGDSVLLVADGQPVARVLRAGIDDDEAHVPDNEVEEAFHGD